MNEIEHEPKDTDEQQKPLTKKSKPVEVLPSARIKFENQLDLLRAYAAASSEGQKTVSNKDVANLVNLAESTVSLGNAFFSETGLIIKAGGGYYPSSEVLNYHQAHKWQPEKASEKLAPLLRGSWFSQCLTPSLEMRDLDERDALAKLAEKAKVDPSRKAQLRMLVDYLEVAGIIERKNDHIALVKISPKSSSTRPPMAGKTKAESITPIARPGLTEGGGLALDFKIHVDMKEISRWSPERITAFMSGIAQVLAAQSGSEKDTEKDDELH